jgi:1-acyl-sn-glycerol-3-phosphate acyltransferase
LVFLRLLYRLPLLLFHLLIGTPATVLCQAPFGWAIRIGPRTLAQVMAVWWGGVICVIFGVRRRVSGSFPEGPQLVAANHTSWVDIVLLQSLAPMVFVAKYEISRWPLLGWMARSGGTVFHQRGSHDSASGVASAMAGRLAEGRKIAIFPEGGILPGEGVKRFHARLFAAAIDTETPVQPVMLRFIRDGERIDDMNFRQGEHFVGNFLRLLCQPGCTADVRVLPPLETAGQRRRQLAASSEVAVRAAFESGVEND